MFSSFQYAGLNRPFVKREPDVTGAKPKPGYGGGKVNFDYSDGFGEAAGFNKPCIGFPDHQSGQILNYAPYLPHGGRLMSETSAHGHPGGGRGHHEVVHMDQAQPHRDTAMFAPENTFLPSSCGPMSVRFIGGVPEMVLMDEGTSQLDDDMRGRENTVPDAKRKRETDHLQPYEEMNVEKVESTVDGASLQKRKRNRIAQKKYRERKKTETSRVMGELNQRKQTLTEMETFNASVVEEHTRNAVLTKLKERKDKEIERLQKLLASINDDASDVPSGSVSEEPCSSETKSEDDGTEMPASTFEEDTERAIVMDIIGDKFVEDMFGGVVKDLKNKVCGHIGCERRLPLLLNVVQDRLLKSRKNKNKSLKNI